MSVLIINDKRADVGFKFIMILLDDYFHPSTDRQ